MKNKSNWLIILLLLTGAFLAGRIWTKSQQDNKVKEGEERKNQEEVVFSPQKREKPRVEFFVMSFCPYGNQAEAGLKPVADLLGDQVEWQPHYIVTKVEWNQWCSRYLLSNHKDKCPDYIQKGYFKNEEECYQAFYRDEQECIQKQGLSAGGGEGFVSLHGLKELKQDVREMCAWRLSQDKARWWQFVMGVNENCSLEDVDQCWEKEAEKAGFSPDKITDCLKNQGIALLEEEVKASRQYGVSSSPSVFINGEAYPPSGSYEEGKVLGVRDSVFEVQEYRSPEAYKEAICAAFTSPPAECQKTLSRGALKSTGGCQ